MANPAIVIDLGETKRISSNFVNIAEVPTDPSPAPHLFITHPNGTVDNFAEINTGQPTGTWFYDWDTSSLTQEGRYLLEVRGTVGTFVDIDKFFAYVYAVDIVDDVIDDLQVTYLDFDFGEEEMLRGLVAEKVYLAINWFLRIPEVIVLDWSATLEYEIVQLRAEILLLRALRRRATVAGFEGDFTIAQFQVRSSVRARSPVDQIADLIKEMQEELKTKVSQFKGSEIPYKRAIFKSFAPSASALNGGGSFNFPRDSVFGIFNTFP